MWYSAHCYSANLLHLIHRLHLLSVSRKYIVSPKQSSIVQIFNHVKTALTTVTLSIFLRDLVTHLIHPFAYSGLWSLSRLSQGGLHAVQVGSLWQGYIFGFEIIILKTLTVSLGRYFNSDGDGLVSFKWGCVRFWFSFSAVSAVDGGRYALKQTGELLPVKNDSFCQKILAAFQRAIPLLEWCFYKSMNLIR